MFNKFPTIYRERQETLHSRYTNTKRINFKRKYSSYKIQTLLFKHWYSCTKDIDNIEQDERINKDKKIAKVIDQYGEEDAYVCNAPTKQA